MNEEQQKEEEERIKRYVKEGVKEWLSNEKKAAYEGIGEWVMRSVIILMLGAMVYLILWANGFKHQ